MRGSISRALLFVGCSVGAALAMAGPAQAASSRAGATPNSGSPPGHGSVTCQAFAFDPDPGVLIDRAGHARRHCLPAGDATR